MMDRISFSDFYSQLSAKRLEAVCESVEHEALTEILDRVKSRGGAETAILEELLKKLPSIILDISAAICTHLLHEYHEWLAQQKLGEGGKEHSVQSNHNQGSVG